MPSHTAVLGTLDQLSPVAYINMSLCFPTPFHDAAVRRLRNGLQETVKQLPFLGGQIYPTSHDCRKHAVISWSDEGHQVQLEEISIPNLPTYAELEQKHMPLTLLSNDLRPLQAREPGKFPRLGAFALSFARVDGGLILTVAVHHQLTDGGGVDVLIDALARNTRGEKVMCRVDPKEPIWRKDRFEALINQTPTQDSFSSPIAHLTESNFSLSSLSAPFETLLFRLSIKALDQLRNQLAQHTSENVSINTACSALLWYVVSRTQIKRLKEMHQDLEVSQMSSMLLLTKGMRKLFLDTGFMGDSIWFGNSNMMCMPPAIVPFLWLDAEDKGHGDFPEVLPKIVDLITRSVSATSLELVAGFLKPMIKKSYEPDFDFTTQLQDTPLYRPLNFISTSIAALDFYQDFGPNLGRPQFVRPLAASLDGVSGAVTIPRKRGDCWTEEEQNTLEVVLGLHPEDANKIVNSEWLRPYLLSTPQ